MKSKAQNTILANFNDQNLLEGNVGDSFCMRVSIIIPVYNEADIIGELVEYLKTHASEAEIIVVDGGSDDGTLAQACKAGARGLAACRKGRAAQMNEGAERATGDIFYFVHADTFPPHTCLTDIRQSVKDGHKAGCFRSTFNSNHPMLQLNAFMTRFGGLLCRGGDQTLFITRKLFEQLGGFRDDYVIMEDFEMVERIEQSTDFSVIPNEVRISARKYEQNSYFKVQLSNLIVFLMYYCGASQKSLLQTYNRLIRQTKF